MGIGKCTYCEKRSLELRNTGGGTLACPNCEDENRLNNYLNGNFEDLDRSDLFWLIKHYKKLTMLTDQKR